MSSDTDKLEFEYPVDFLDPDEAEQAPPPPLPFKASSILYISGGLLFWMGIMLPLLEMMARPGLRPDTIIEMLEWNPFSQLGMIGIINGLFLFWLGLLVDRRNA